jgi:hypothetical protein
MQTDRYCGGGLLKQRKECNHKERKEMAYAHPTNNKWAIEDRDKTISKPSTSILTAFEERNLPYGTRERVCSIKYNTAAYLDITCLI